MKPLLTQKCQLPKCLVPCDLQAQYQADRFVGRRGTWRRNSIYLFACQSLPLGQQLWHKASIQQMFDDELHKNMIHVECVKIKIVVLGLGGN